MSSNSSNIWFFVGAAVVGLVSAAGVFLIEQFRQEKRRHAFTQDLARMDGQLSTLRQELESLRQLQNERGLLHSKSNRRRIKSGTSLSSTSTEYRSAIDSDSSESEFYDLSNDEDGEVEREPLETEFAAIDRLLANEMEYEEPLRRLEVIQRRYPDNADIMWRLGKALKVRACLTVDLEDRKEIINTGIAICERATELQPNSAVCHKWMAILVGQRGDLQPTRERILDGLLFKSHIESAIALTPRDASLHHMLGRFIYEVAKLNWLERRVASTLFAQLPDYSYQDALDCFMEAERLNETDWKENRLFIAKCQLGIGQMAAAIEWLNKAERSSNDEDDKVHEEVKVLLEKHKQPESDY